MAPREDGDVLDFTLEETTIHTPISNIFSIDLNVLPTIDDDAMDLSTRRRRDITEEQSKQIYQTLLAKSMNGKLGKNVTKEVAAQFGVHVRTVQRLWHDGKTYLSQGISVNVGPKKRGRSGRKPTPVNLEELRSVDLKNRTTLEDVCKILSISKSKLLKHIRQGDVKRHTNSIKPHLTDANKKARLQWCVDMLEHESLQVSPRFKSLFDHVFIDEKWFFLTRKSERYYLLPDEDEPLRTCRSKNNIPKLMFLCVTARPRFENGVCTFDGKIGCFPLVTYERAKRSSINRQAGTLEVKPITSVTRGVIREFMIDKVLPAIRAKWPREDVNNPIYIQQDNAPSHLELDDPLFCQAAKQGGFDIRLICQPPNSPDFNILDLGFFRAIQSIQYKKVAKTVEHLIPVVQEAFNEYSPKKTNRIYVTLQLVLKESMKVAGSNKYKIPHMKKGTLERQGRLPLQIICEASLVVDAMIKLAA